MSNILVIDLGSDEHVELLIALEAGDDPPAGVFIIASASAKIRKQAAMRLARALGRQLTPISLEAVKSDMIGETEKNLTAFFEAAQAHNWVLFFDEADALFGNKPTRDADLSSVVRELVLNTDAPIITGATRARSPGRFWKDFMTVVINA
jgi:SpoVK/Ycf46/Vps4 family AAA+-type ATPase